MAQNIVQVGLVGLGRLGRIYADQLADGIYETSLVAVADPEPQALAYIAERWPDTRCYKKTEKLLEDPAVEAVVIVSPTHTHKRVVLAALSAGKPVFCEKPLAVTFEDSIAQRNAVAKSDTLFQMGFMRRFDPAYTAAKAKIEEGVTGRLIMFKSSSRDPYRPSLDYLHPEKSGGIFVDMGIHDFDLALWFMGPVRQVFSTGGVLVYPEIGEIGDIDNAVVSLQFESGAIGQVDLSRNGVYAYDISTELMGTAGTIRIGYLRETPIQIMTKNSVSHDTVPHFLERFSDAYRLQLRNFALNIIHGRQPCVLVEDGVEAFRVALAAQKSYESGTSVMVNEIGT